jgi:hypothetical protein
MTILAYAGDALWIIALSIMAGAARNAWGRMNADTMVPMWIRLDGSPGWRARRLWALCALPAFALAVSLFLVVGNRGLGGDEALILFGVRASSAGLFPLIYLRWLKPAMALLEAEGALRPQ